MSAPLPDALRLRFRKLVEERLSGRAAALRLTCRQQQGPDGRSRRVDSRDSVGHSGRNSSAVVASRPFWSHDSHGGHGSPVLDVARRSSHVGPAPTLCGRNPEASFEHGWFDAIHQPRASSPRRHRCSLRANAPREMVGLWHCRARPGCFCRRCDEKRSKTAEISLKNCWNRFSVVTGL